LKELTEELIIKDKLLRKLNCDLQSRLDDLSSKYSELLGRVEQLEKREANATG
jgi:hypothetical protein